jgi:hypothetical protein
VAAFLGAWDVHHEVFAGLIRTTIAAADAAPPALDVLRNVVLGSLLGVLEGPDSELRANLVVAQLIGMAVLRYVLRIPPLTSAPAKQVVEQFGPALQALITPRTD